MTDVGERVVLAEDRHGRRARAGVAAERRLDAGIRRDDAEVVRDEERREPRARLALLVGELGLAVDGERQLDERVPGAVDRRERVARESVLGHRRRVYGAVDRAASVTASADARR